MCTGQATAKTVTSGRVNQSGSVWTMVTWADGAQAALSVWHSPPTR